MGAASIRKVWCHWLPVAAGTAIIIVAYPTFAARSSYDGSYSGGLKVTFGTGPVCGQDGNISVTVKDARIQYGFGAFPLKMDVAQDGTFSGRARKGNRGGGQVVRVKGRIANSALEADLNVAGVHGRVCSYHWSLQKA